jgi:hypothetical protein
VLRGAAFCGVLKVGFLDGVDLEYCAHPWIFTDSPDSFPSWSGVVASLFVWTANIVLLIVCLVKLLIFGDPVLVTKSKASIEYWKHKKQSNIDFERVSTNTWFCGEKNGSGSSTDFFYRTPFDRKVIRPNRHSAERRLTEKVW